MGKKKASHLHRLKRIPLGKNGYQVYKCMKPHCSYMIAVNLVEGQVVECNRCLSPMMMDKKAMELAKPHCEDCTRGRVPDKTVDVLIDFFKEQEP